MNKHMENIQRQRCSKLRGSGGMPPKIIFKFKVSELLFLTLFARRFSVIKHEGKYISWYALFIFPVYSTVGKVQCY